MNHTLEAAADRSVERQSRRSQDQHARPLTSAALERGELAVLSEMGIVGGFLETASNERLPSPYFGMISTPELVSNILFNKDATDQQLAAAARDLRKRLVDAKAEDICWYASREL